MSTPPSLYQWAGGKAAFRALIDAFYNRVEHDDLLSPLFPRRCLREASRPCDRVVGRGLRRPQRYTAALSGYGAMLHHHRGLGVTPEQRFRFATLMSRAADDAGMPDDPGFRAAFVGYVEWGTRLALHNSQQDADVVEEAPVPRWGWGVAPPYQP